MKFLYKKNIMRGAVAGVLATFAAVAPTALHAVPAYPGVIDVTQPDGSRISVRLAGDEHGHRAYTADGYLLMHDADGYLVYAAADASGMPVSSGLRAADPARRGAGERAFLSALRQTEVAQAFERMEMRKAAELKRAGASATRAGGENPVYLQRGAAFPSNGSPRALVVLVEYQDKAFTMNDPKDFYTRMLNEEGFAEYGATGSARDFYVENSGGVFTPQFDVYGPVKLKYDMRHYGANNYYGDDAAPEEMVIEACDALDAEGVDFSVYDTNGDGQIDNVFIFYAGYGEADSYVADAVWPHSADILDFQLGKDYTYDGLILNRYGCTCEISYANARPDGIGTFVHEFSHVMGLPDLYATEYTNSFTPGSYSVLDVGPYNNKGRTPPHYSSFERYCLDWLTPEKLEVSGEYELEALHKSNKGYILPTAKENEFFMLENRQQECCDAFIPGHGMVVWHIDYDKKVWDANAVNNVRSHQYVDLVEADGRQSDNTRNGDTFPGKFNITEFNADTYPALVDWDKQGIGVGLSRIREEGGVIRFHAEVKDITGVEAVGESSARVEINGRMLSNLTACEAMVYDLTGNPVARVEPGGSAELPAGIYIAVAADKSFKLYVR